MNESISSVVSTATQAAADMAPVVPTQTGDILRTVAGYADKNQPVVIGIAAVATVAVGYLAYRAFTNREEN